MKKVHKLPPIPRESNILKLTLETVKSIDQAKISGRENPLLNQVVQNNLAKLQIHIKEIQSSVSANAVATDKTIEQQESHIKIYEQKLKAKEALIKKYQNM